MFAEITKENINNILKDLGKEYRKRAGRYMPAEIVITGGAAIIVKYGFRDTSYDIDAIIRASSALQDATLAVRDKYGLQHKWLNSDFQNTTSYSDKLREHSHHYRTFSNVLNVRTVDAEYLLATKLRAARPYKHDLSDIAGIITEERANNPNFTKELVIKAYREMYGEDADVNRRAKEYMDKAFATENPKAFIRDIRYEEKEANRLLADFQTEYPNVLKEDNLSEILYTLQKKTSSKT